MAARPPERVGLVIVRVWVERTDANGLRARLTFTPDVAKADDAFTVTAAAATVDGICDTVRTWLEEFISA